MRSLVNESIVEIGTVTVTHSCERMSVIGDRQAALYRIRHDDEYVFD
jgi:hypothetical protein